MNQAHVLLPVLHLQILLRQSLCANPELMGRVTLVAAALSNRTRFDCTLVSLDGNRGNGVLSCGEVRYGGARQRSARPVQLYALDDVLAGVDSIAMIKMVGAAPLLWGMCRGCPQPK